jgi:hypothetical protein
MAYNPVWSNVNADPAHDDSGDGLLPTGTNQVVSYNSFGGSKPAAIGDPALNYLWIGTANDWIVFELSGSGFVANRVIAGAATNWGGTITMYLRER